MGKRKRAKDPFSSFNRSLSSFQYQEDDEMKASQTAVEEAYLHVEEAYETFFSSSKSHWEVSDFLSSADAGDE